MKLKLIVIIIFILFLIGCNINSQRDYEVITKTREQIQYENKIQLNITSEVKENKIKHALIKLNSDSLEDITELKELGINFLSESRFNEPNTWWVSIPIEKIITVSEKEYVLYLKEISAEEKLYFILNNPLPTNAKNDDGSLNIIVMCFEDVNICENIVNKYKLNVTKISKNSFEVYNIENSSLFKIANEDIVASIGSIGGLATPSIENE